MGNLNWITEHARCGTFASFSMVPGATILRMNGTPKDYADFCGCEDVHIVEPYKDILATFGRNIWAYMTEPGMCYICVFSDKCSEGVIKAAIDKVLAECEQRTLNGQWYTLQSLLDESDSLRVVSLVSVAITENKDNYLIPVAGVNWDYSQVLFNQIRCNIDAERSVRIFCGEHSIGSNTEYDFIQNSIEGVSVWFNKAQQNNVAYSEIAAPIVAAHMSSQYAGNYSGLPFVDFLRGTRSTFDNRGTIKEGGSFSSLLSKAKGNN